MHGEDRLLGGLRSDLYPALGAIFHVGIVAFRVAAVMPVVGCRGLRGLRYFPLYVNRRCGRYSNYGGIGDRRITVSHSPVSISISVGGGIIGSAAVITKTNSAQ
jgi:hypothetical protein